MKILQAKQRDYKQLMQLYNLFVKEDRYSEYNNDSFKQVLKNKNSFIFVAKQQNKLAGFIFFSVRMVIRYPKPIAELDELFVSEEFRQEGTGKKLMEAMEKKIKEIGCRRIYIESAYKHKIAHKFYRALGYINYGYHFIKKLTE